VLLSPAFTVARPTSRHELDDVSDMTPRPGNEAEGGPRQQYYDDDNVSVHSDDADAILIHGSEASDEETFSQEPYHARKYIPTRIQKAWKKTAEWVKGPQPPRQWKIRPFFPRVQTAPIQLLNNYFPKRKHRVALLVFFYFCWFLSFSLVLHRSAFAADIPGHGSPVRIRCTDRLW